MTFHNPDESVIRRYLLSDVTEDEREDIEERTMTDDEFFDHVNAHRHELVDQYVDEGMSKEERARFEKLFLSTPQGRQQIAFARALRQYRGTPGAIAEPASGPQKRRVFLPLALSVHPYLKIAASLLLIATTSWIVWRVFIRDSALNEGTSALRAAYRSVRPTESRLTVLDYARWSGTRGRQDPAIDRISLTEAEGLLAGAARKQNSASANHALGVYYLAQGRFDEAITLFGEALKEDPKNAGIYSDLGAAWLEKGKSDFQEDTAGRSREAMARALEPLNTALEIDGSLLSAVFNRALCRQYLGMLELAAEDWNSYIARDPSSPWAGEARENLDKIEEQRRRSSVDSNTLLDEFIAAYRAGDREAGENLLNEAEVGARNHIVEGLTAVIFSEPRATLSIGPAEALSAMRFAADVRERPQRGEQASDRFLADLFRACSAPNPVARRAIADGRGLLDRARRNMLRAEGDLPETLSLFDKAIHAFTTAGDKAEAASARLTLAQYRLRTGQPEQALLLARRLASECESLKYSRLLGRSLGTIAQACTYFDRSKDANENARRGLSVFQRVGATSGIIGQYAQLALLYQRVHDGVQALGFLHRAFAEGAVVRMDENQRLGILGAAADVCESLTLNDAAVDYQRESLRGYEALGASPFELSRYHALFGSMLIRFGRFDEATASLFRALELGEKLEDRDQGRDAVAFVSLRLGHAYLQLRQYSTAFGYFNRRIEYSNQTKVPVESYAAHKGRLLCYLALGMDIEAAEEIKTVLRLFEEYRPKIGEEASRNAFFDRENDTYDVAIDFAFSRLQDEDKAFDYCEASHARSLLDGSGDNVQLSEKEYGLVLELTADQQPLTLDAVKQALPGSVQLVQYAVLDDKLLAWVVSNSKSECNESKVTSRELQAKIEAYLAALQARSNYNENEVAQQARELHDLVVKPIETLLDRKQVVCIVPDKSLNRLPFNLLVSRETGRHVLEDYRLMLAPSATLFIKYSQLAQRKRESGEVLVAVGGPRFDQREFRLEALPDARAEAEKIGTLYGIQSRVFTSGDATEGTVRQALQMANVVHFATHYVTDERWPLKSGLLLTAEPVGASKPNGIDGVLRVGDVYAMKLPRTKLAILAGCATGVEQSLRGEGAIGMARPFLKAGVPLVVASLWPVDSRATRDLMIAFHRWRKEGKTTIEALRLAQTESTKQRGRSGLDSNTWAAFVLVGGLADY